jgi:hypothetical protein
MDADTADLKTVLATLMAKMETMQENMATKMETMQENMATKMETMQENMATKSDMENMATKSDMENMATKMENMKENMATKMDNMQEDMATKIDNMATKSDVNVADLSRLVLAATNPMALSEFRNSHVISDTTYKKAIIAGKWGGTWTLMRANVKGGSVFWLSVAFTLGCRMQRKTLSTCSFPVCQRQSLHGV